MLGVRGAIAFRFPPVPPLDPDPPSVCKFNFAHNSLWHSLWLRRCNMAKISMRDLPGFAAEAAAALPGLPWLGLVWAHYRRHRQRESFVSALVKLQADGGGDDA